jgi:GTP pyrophosphokinase
LAEHTQIKDTESLDFEKDLKVDYFSDRIFVFTPKGEVIDLPIGSTPVDFAYQVHTTLGNTITGARINGHFKALNTELKNGDIVEIISKAGEKPNKK